jgi:hypothetical protein
MYDDVSSLPCDQCRHLERCCREPIACESAALFLSTGRYSAVAPRQPTRAIFERIHSPPAQRSPEERDRMQTALRLGLLRQRPFGV